MRIREYTSADLVELQRMHAAQNFGYPFPNLDSPLFLSKLVLEEDESGDLPNDLPTENGAREGREALHRDSLPEHATNNETPRSRITMAVLLRLTAETYLLHDPAAGTPPLRWQRFLALHEAARHSAAARGLDDVQAFLPPRVARAFGRRLSRLGWTRDPWACFSRKVM
jgi:hypothetical protein